MDKSALKSSLEQAFDDDLIAVRVTPNASRAVIKVEAGQVRVYVTVVPEGGKANKAVVKLLAKSLGIAKSTLELIRGETSRDKVFRRL